MAATVLDGPDVVRAHLGRHLGFSEWITIDQSRVDLFADATDDHQWIHTDPERAASGPFGAPIAHGYLTLSLAPVLLPQAVATTGFRMGVNYGCNKVRFMSPVPVGANLRLGVKLLAVDDIAGGIQSTYELTFEIDGNPKPACVAECIYRSYL